MVRETLESEQYQDCVKEYSDNPELKDGILQSLLEDASIPTSSAVPAGFAGFYELIGIVSHMVEVEEWYEIGRFAERRPLCGVGEEQGKVVQMRRRQGQLGDQAHNPTVEGWKRSTLGISLFLSFCGFECVTCLFRIIFLMQRKEGTNVGRSDFKLETGGCAFCAWINLLVARKQRVAE